jgi:hypothetical protein
MILSLLSALLLAVAPAQAPAAQHQDHAQHEGMKHEGPCCDEQAKKDCCKGDKPMPCCEKKAADAKADAGAHNHAH